ncbi:hypothetical protein D1872_288250 [compost metagenome]
MLDNLVHTLLLLASFGDDRRVTRSLNAPNQYQKLDKKRLLTEQLEGKLLHLLPQHG